MFYVTLLLQKLPESLRYRRHLLSDVACGGVISKYAADSLGRSGIQLCA
jgi:hypothetical protein